MGAARRAVGRLNGCARELTVAVKDAALVAVGGDLVRKGAMEWVGSTVRADAKCLRALAGLETRAGDVGFIQGICECISGLMLRFKAEAERLKTVSKAIAKASSVMHSRQCVKEGQ